MPDAPEREAGSGTIQGKITFAVDTGEKPKTYPEKPFDDPSQRTGKYEERTITLHDARPIADELSIDVQGYELTSFSSKTKDFYDEDELKRVFYPECIEIVKNYLGCDEVVVIDHTFRIEDVEKRERLGLRSPVPLAHNDFTDWSGRKRVHDFYDEAEAEERLKHRVVSLNVWQPLTEPVVSMPLVLCDARTLGPKDLVAADHIYTYRRGETYRVAYSEGQRWYYFSNMHRDEVAILKCFDTDTSRCRFSAHGSADVGPPPPGVPPRESVEVRTLAFFKD